MTTQTIQFDWVAGRASNMASALYLNSSGSSVATASPVEDSNIAGRYTSSFNNLTAGQYVLVVTDGGAVAVKAVRDITATTATFGPTSDLDVYDRVGAPAGVSISADVAAIKGVLPSALSANGNIKSSLVEIIGTTLSETAGQLAAGFKKFFNVGSPSSTMNEITLVDTVTSYTGNTPQTGDAFGRLGAPAGASVSADIAALLAAVQNVQNNIFIAAAIPQELALPSSGSQTINIVLAFADETGTAKNLDSGNPTIGLTNDVGTDRSGRLGSWTNPATGKYVVPYTASAADALEGLHWDVTGTINSKLRRTVAFTQLVETISSTFTSSDRSLLTTVYNKLPVNNLADQSILSAQVGSPMQSGASVVVAANNDKTGYSLTSAYDAAKTAAQTGSKMDLVDGPNATAVSAIQSGLATHTDSTAIETAIAMIPTTPAPTVSQIAAELFTSGPANKLTVNTDGSVNADATVDISAIAAAVVSSLTTSGVTVNEASEAAITASLATALASTKQIIVQQPPVTSTQLTLIQGDDYLAADGRGLVWTLSGTYPDFTGASVAFLLNGTPLKTGTVLTATGSTRIVQVELAASDISSMPVNMPSGCAIVVTLANGHQLTPVKSKLLVVTRT